MLHLVVGEKPDVGVGVLSNVLADYLLERSETVVAVDGEAAGDALMDFAFHECTRILSIDPRVPSGWADLVEIAAATPSSEHIVVRLPAGISNYLAQVAARLCESVHNPGEALPTHDVVAWFVLQPHLNLAAFEEFWAGTGRHVDRLVLVRNRRTKDGWDAWVDSDVISDFMADARCGAMDLNPLDKRVAALTFDARPPIRISTMIERIQSQGLWRMFRAVALRHWWVGACAELDKVSADLGICKAMTAGLR